MSPSEHDLRAALRDGEDDGVDVDRLVSDIRSRRAQRRTRVLSTAAAVVVVASAAVGGAALWAGSDGGGPQAGSPGATGRPAGSVTGRPEPAGTGADTHAADPGCPASAPQAVDPPGLTPSTAPKTAMFAAPVRSVLVCGYTETGSASAATAAPLVLVGDNATALVTSIENASTSKLKVVCPAIAAAQQKQLAIIGVTAGGVRLPTVTTDISIPNCNQPITNGTAVRYAWKPPASLASLIGNLTSGTGSGPTAPTGRIPTSPAGVIPTAPAGSGGNGLNGSPVR